MSFDSPQTLLLLSLLPTAVLFLRWAAVQRDRALRKVGFPPALESSRSVGRTRLKAGLWLTALASLIVGLAGPRWGTEQMAVVLEGTDVLFAVDISRSMWVSDVPPSRLEVARSVVHSLAPRIPGRVGLMIFAGSAELLCPLTEDLEAFSRYLDGLEQPLLAEPGTQLDLAFQGAARAFGKDARKKALIVISDGEDHGPGIEPAAKALKEAGIQVFAVGVGTPEGGPVPADSGNPPGTKRDATGRPIVSRLREGTLQRAALAGGGAYRRANQPEDVARFLEAGLTRWGDEDKLGSGETRKGPTDLSFIETRGLRVGWLALAAVLALMGESLCSENAGLRTP